MFVTVEIIDVDIPGIGPAQAELCTSEDECGAAWWQFAIGHPVCRVASTTGSRDYSEWTPNGELLVR